MSYAPKSGCLNDTICKAMLPRGAMTIHQIIDLMSAAPRKQVISSVNHLRASHALTYDEKKYSLTAAMRRHYGEEVELPKATAREHETKPMNSKYYLPRTAPRPDAPELRDMPFVTCSGVPSKVWGGV